MPKVRSQADVERKRLYDAYLLDAVSCNVCGRTESEQPRGWFKPFYLQRVHLAAGSGTMRRVEDVRAVIIGCSLCHELHSHQGEPVKINGQLFRGLSDANMIWIKRDRDPANYDPEFIDSLWLGRVPDAVEPIWEERKNA